MQDFVKINETDNVAVALRPVAKGETLQIWRKFPRAIRLHCCP